MARLNINKKWSVEKDLKVEGFTGKTEVLVRRVRFAKNSWCVLVCETAAGAPLTCTGVFHVTPRAGNKIYVRGEWVEDATYGWQFKVLAGYIVDVAKADLESSDGIERWLMRLPEIGPVRAALVAKKFGDDAIQVLENEPEAYLEIPGITEERLKAIQDALAHEKIDAELMRWLIEIGLDDKIIDQAIERYGKHFADVVEERPYELIKLRAATWPQIDVCGRELGFADDHPDRIGMTLWWVTDCMCRGKPYKPKARTSSSGHTCVAKTLVRNAAMDLLRLEAFDPILYEMDACRWVVSEDEYVSTLGMFNAEQTIADAILNRRTDHGHE